MPNDRVDRIANAVKAWAAQSDDLSFSHGGLLLRQIQGQCKRLERALIVPPFDCSAEYVNQCLALVSVVESFAVWVSNYQRGLIELEPSQELI